MNRLWQKSQSFHEDLAFLALVYSGDIEKLATRVNQVKISDLASIVPENAMKLAMDRFNDMKVRCNVDNLEFECPVDRSVENDEIMFNLSGEIDAVDSHNKNIFEFKCTNELESKHVLQVMMYAYMYQEKHSIKDVYLFNVKTGELRKIIYDEEKARKIILDLLKEKEKRPSNISDEKFITKYRRATIDYI